MKKTFLIALAVVLSAVVILSVTHKADAYDGSSYPFFLSVKNSFQNQGGTWFVPSSVSCASNLGLPDRVTFIKVVQDTFKVTRIQSPTYPSGVQSTASRFVVLQFAGTDTLVDGVNLKLAGNFNGTADDVIALCYRITGAASDTFWTELWRSVN